MGFWHIIFGLFGGSEAESAAEGVVCVCTVDTPLTLEHDVDASLVTTVTIDSELCQP